MSAQPPLSNPAYLRDLDRIRDDLPLILLSSSEKPQSRSGAPDLHLEDSTAVVAVDSRPSNFLCSLHALDLALAFEGFGNFIRHRHQRISLLLRVREQF